MKAAIALASVASQLAATGVLLLGCSHAAPDEIRVFAASSLTDVMTTIAAHFERETGTKVKCNFAASSTLAQQIVQGAQCDVFLSADRDWADFVERGIPGEPLERETLLTSSLIVVRRKVPGARLLGVSDGGLDGLDLLNQTHEVAIRNALMDPEVRRIAIGDPEQVPVGKYARKALTGLALWDSCRTRMISCDSARAALRLVEQGEADAGIVFRIDAGAEGVESVLTIDGDVAVFPGVEARYEAMAIGGRSPAAARFLVCLRAPWEQKVFTDAGFGVVPQSK